jgi:hypothetical protein
MLFLARIRQLLMVCDFSTDCNLADHLLSTSLEPWNDEGDLAVALSEAAMWPEFLA